MTQNNSLLVFLLLIFSISIRGSEKPHVINITPNMYKAASKNWSINQDERGVMYFGNDIGLLESDGMDWKLYRVPNSPIVRAIAISSHETIFTGGFEEIGRWDRDISGTLKYTSLKHLLDKSLQNENIWKVWIFDNNVYFQSFSNIYVYNHKTLEQITIPGGFLFLLKVGDEYWVQKMYGELYQLKNNTLQKIEGSELFNGTLSRVILPYEQGNYLIGTSSGDIYRYDGTNYTIWNKRLSDQLQGQELNCGLYSSKRNTYYLGTQLGGLYEVDASGEILNYFSTSNSLQNNTILSLHEDNLNNIWVAMDRGLAYIRYTDGLSYYKATERDAGAVYDATFWNGHLLIGTNQGVYYASQEKLNEQNLFSHLKLINGTQGQVWSFQEIDGKLYCGHNNALLEIHPNLTVSDAYKLNTGVFRVIEASIKDVDLLLVVTYKNLVIIEKETGVVTTMKQIDDPIINVEVDHLENIWLETVSRGAYRCKYDVNSREYQDYTYYENDEQVKLKLFKAGGRILFMGNDRFWSYSENEDKLIPNHILNDCFHSVNDLKKVVHIKSDLNWAITGSSVHQFIYDGYGAQIIESFNINADNLSLINAYENISVLNDSTSMICLDAGFILYTAKDNSTGINKLPVPHIEAIQTGNVNENPHYYYTDKEADIPYNFNDVTIHFSVSDAFASSISVQYYLTGVDNTWSTPGKTNKVTYDRLPEGNYTFYVRTTDGLGHHSESTSFSFNILPAWYLTIWAYLLYVLIIIGILYLVWIMILRRYRNIHLQKIRARETQNLRMMNEKLTHEIEEKNAELFTQTSFIIQKNELILKLKNIVDEFCTKNPNKAILPLYQKMNALLEKNLDSENDWRMFLIKFEQKHDGFFKRLKAMYPELTNNDLRLCACLKLNLDTKDIASLMNLSVRAVENNRYRLRKKMNLEPTQNLNEYFLGID